MGTNVIHSLCVSASVPLIARKRYCLWVSSTLRICVHCRMPSYIAPPFPVTPTFTSVILHRVLELLCWTSWLSILSYWPSSHRYWLCSIPLTALLWHYPRKIVGLYITVTWWLLGYSLHAQSVLCCRRTPVTSSSHCCLCMHHVALL